MSDQHVQPRVFVVDDEFVIATTLATILQRNGFDAISFTEPKKALQAARLNAPDLLLSDVFMPEISGVDLAIQFKQSCPKCRVMLFSGQAATANLLEAARLQGHDFQLLTKPIHPTDLLKNIKAATADCLA